MSIITLDQMIEGGIKHANHVLLKKHKPALAPLYILITADDRIITLPVAYNSDADKNRVVALVAATASLENAVKAMFISEGWMLQLPPPLTPWSAARQMENLPRPSESPDRIEVVQIIATDGNTTRSRRLQMLRDSPGGKLIALVPMVNPDHMESSGRMIDGIIPRKEETS